MTTSNQKKKKKTGLIRRIGGALRRLARKVWAGLSYLGRKALSGVKAAGRGASFLGRGIWGGTGWVAQKAFQGTQYALGSVLGATVALLGFAQAAVLGLAWCFDQGMTLLARGVARITVWMEDLVAQPGDEAKEVGNKELSDEEMEALTAPAEGVA